MSKRNRKRQSRESLSHTRETPAAQTASEHQPAVVKTDRSQTQFVTHLNTRFLIAVLLLLAVLGTGIFVLHDFQVKRNSAVLKERAESSIQQGDSEKAIELLSRYLRLAPHDLEALAMLGELIDRSPPTLKSRLRAYQVYSELIRAAPDREDAPRIRYRLAQLMISLGRHTQAEHQLAKLLKLSEGTDDGTPALQDADFDRADLVYLQAQCHAAQDRSEAALACMLAATIENPKRFEYYTDAIRFASELGDMLPERDEMEQLLSSDPLALSSAPDRLLAQFPEQSQQVPEQSPRDRAAGLPLKDPAAPGANGMPPLDLRTEKEILQTAAQPLIDYLLDAIAKEVQPAFEGRLARADYFLQRGDFEQVDLELQKIPVAERDEPEVTLFEARYAFADAERLSQEGQNEEALQAILTAERTAKRGRQIDELDLRYDLFLAKAMMERYRYETDPEIRNELPPKACDILKAAIEKLPASRRAYADLEDIEERDLKFLMLNLLEVNLRSQLVLTNLSILESEQFDSLKSASLASIERRIDELRDLTRDDGLLLFLNARKRYARLVNWTNLNSSDPSRDPADAAYSWGAVVEDLKRARLQVADRQNDRRSIDLMLNRCYRELDHDEARLALFKDVFEKDTNWRRGRLELALALKDVGELEEANRNFVTLWRQWGIRAAPAEIVRLHIRYQQSLPAEEQDWDQVYRLVTELRQSDPENPSLRLLDVEIKSQQKQFAEAEQILTEMLEIPDLTRKQRIETWQSKIQLQLLRRDRGLSRQVAAATDLLEAARQQLGDCVELDLCELMIAERTSDEALTRKAQQFQNSLEDYPKSDRVRILEALIAGYGRLELPEKQHTLWKQIAKLRPDKLSYRTALCRVALQNDRQNEFRRHLREIRRIEGPGGPQGNFEEAIWHIDRLKKALNEGKKSADLTHHERALELLERLEEQRPRWDRVPVIQGVLAGLLGDELKQFEYYRKAIALGAVQPEITEFVMAYLQRNGRGNELVALSERLRQAQPQTFTTEMRQRLAQAYYKQDRMIDAFTILRETVENADRFQQELTEGFIKLIQFENQELEDPDSEALEKLFQDAEQHFLAAAEAAPEQGRVWTGLVLFYIKTGRFDDARLAVEKAEASLPEQPPLLKPLILARCYEMLGDVGQTTNYYNLAAKADPENVSLHMQLAEYASRIKDRKMERSHLRKIQTLSQDQAPSIASQAADRLAHLDSIDGTWSDALRAIRELERTLPEESASRLRNLLTQWQILRRFAVHDFQEKMVNVLEQIDQIQPLEIPDRLVQINLCKALGDEQQADRKLQQLLADYPHVLLVHTFATEHFISTEQFSKAREQLDFLRVRLPDTFVIAALEAQLKYSQGDPAAANQIIQAYLNDLSRTQNVTAIFQDSISRYALGSAFDWLTDIESMQNRLSRKRIAEATHRLRDGNYASPRKLLTPLLKDADVQEKIYGERIRECATLLEKFGLLDEAETVYRRYLSVTSNVNAPIWLIALLGRQGKYEEAIRWGERIMNDQNAPEVLNNLEAIVRSGQLSRSQEQRVKRLLDQAVSRSPENVAILRQIADYHDFKQQFAAAERTYLLMLNINPGYTVALNNLSWLLAMRETSPGRSEEARRLIDQAIEVLGPTAELLDTKATVEISAHNYADAIRLLEKSISVSPSAVKYFHLARAQMLAGQAQAARSSFKTAISRGFTPSQLHSLEKSHARELQGAFVARN